MRWLTILLLFPAVSFAEFEASVEYTRAPGPRATRDLDGLKIEFPADEADLVELLKRDFLYERQIRQDTAKNEFNALKIDPAGLEETRSFIWSWVPISGTAIGRVR